MAQGTQIFQAISAKRWNGFKWTMRILLMILLFLIVVLTIAVIRGTMPRLPNLEAKSNAYNPKPDAYNPLTISKNFNKQYKGFKEFLFNKARKIYQEI